MKQCGKKFLVTGLILTLILSLCPLSLSASTTKAAEDKGIVLIYGRIEGSQHWTKDNIYYILTDGSLISPVIIGDLTIDPGTTICLGQGNTSHGQIDDIDVFSSASLRILYGSLTAKGTEEEPIIFKTDKNDTSWGVTSSLILRLKTTPNAPAAVSPLNTANLSTAEKTSLIPVSSLQAALPTRKTIVSALR